MKFLQKHKSCSRLFLFCTVEKPPISSDAFSQPFSWCNFAIFFYLQVCRKILAHWLKWNCLRKTERNKTNCICLETTCFFLSVCIHFIDSFYWEILTLPKNIKYHQILGDDQFFKFTHGVQNPKTCGAPGKC